MADAAVVPMASTFAAVFRFFSFCLPDSVLSLRVLSVFAIADVTVPANPVVAPTVDEIVAPLARLFILDIRQRHRRDNHPIPHKFLFIKTFKRSVFARF